MIGEYHKILQEGLSLSRYQFSCLGIDTSDLRIDIPSRVESILKEYLGRQLNGDDIREMKDRIEELTNLKESPGMFEIVRRRGASPIETPNQWLCSLRLHYHIYKDKIFIKGNRPILSRLSRQRNT